MIRAKYIGLPGKACDEFALGKKIISHAKSEAASVVEQARAEAAQKIGQIRKRAYTNAYDRANNKVEQDYKARVSQLEQEYAETIQRAHQDCLDLTLSIAREVLGEEMKRNHDSLATRIARGIRSIIDNRSLKVRVPVEGTAETIAALKRVLPEKDLTVMPSKDINPGNAVLETNSGMIELDWTTHLAEIEKRLKAKLIQLER